MIMPTFLKSHCLYLIAIAIIAIVSLLTVYFLPTSGTAGGNKVEVDFFIYIATAALALIAYIEIHRANKLNTIELLTFISDRWSSREIIEARQVIHEIFVKNYRHDKKANPTGDFDLAISLTSVDILNMSRECGEKGENFILLLNLLDHFEGVSYFHNNNQIDFQDIKNIYGNNMMFYYKVFKAYIERRQTHNPSDFYNFTQINNFFEKK